MHPVLLERAWVILCCFVNLLSVEFFPQLGIFIFALILSSDSCCNIQWQDVKNSYIVYMVKIESVYEISMVGIKIMTKSGLECVQILTSKPRNPDGHFAPSTIAQVQVWSYR